MCRMCEAEAERAELRRTIDVSVTKAAWYKETGSTCPCGFVGVQGRTNRTPRGLCVACGRPPRCER